MKSSEKEPPAKLLCNSMKGILKRLPESRLSNVTGSVETKTSCDDPVDFFLLELSKYGIELLELCVLNT